MKDTLQKKYLPEITEKIADRLSFRDDEILLGFVASINEYYPTNEKWFNTQLMCTGMDTKDQKWNIIGNRVVISYELDKKQPKKGSYCESEHWMIKNDPRNYTSPDMVKYDYITLPKTVAGPHFAIIFDDFIMNHFWVGRYLQSQMVHFFGSYTHMKELCQQKYPQIPEGRTTSFYDNCALSLIMHKGGSDIVEF